MDAMNARALQEAIELVQMWRPPGAVTDLAQGRAWVTENITGVVEDAVARGDLSEAVEMMSAKLAAVSYLAGLLVNTLDGTNARWLNENPNAIVHWPTDILTGLGVAWGGLDI